MDSTGWHAHSREERNSRYYGTPERGPDGQYLPVEQANPVSNHVLGGFHVAPLSLHNEQHPSFLTLQSPPSSEQFGRHDAPPLYSDRPHFSGQHGVPILQPDFITQGFAQSSVSLDANDSVLSSMSAVERSNYLRAIRMQPYLQLMVGPLLRYDTVDEEGNWYGSCMVVSREAADATSVYDPHPMLTYKWDPHEDESATSGATSQTHGKRFNLGPHPADPHSTIPLEDPRERAQHSHTTRIERVPGHEIWVYEDARGCTHTFWRFLIQIPLGDREMRIRYCVNNGQYLQFYVPGRSQNMRWAAYSCNGFSAGVNQSDFCGPGFNNGYDPVWTDLLQKHEQQPFHVLVGGGDQLYCDGVTREPELQEWLQLSKPEVKLNYEITPDIKVAIDRFYFNHYCRQFQSGAFARATASIPMANMLDDHDLIDGFGSYPDDLQRSPIFNTIGSRGYFFYLLFQCFINVDVDGTDDRRGAHSNKSVIIGQRGPYVPYPSHSFLSYLGPNCYLLLLDCRAERRKDQVCSPYQYRKVFEKLYRLPPQIHHVVIVLGIPIAYPRMNFMETALGSKFNPIIALAKKGSFKLGGFINKFNSDAELLDDLNDHWTSKGHKAERNSFVLNLQEFAQKTHTRITFLTGDVHCAAVGVFKTHVPNKKPALEPAVDHRYMLNVVTSAIVNTPPPQAVVTLVNNRAHKTHNTLHFARTDETMIPLFTRDTDGSTGNSKVIMARRNYCIVEYDSRGNLVFDIRVEKEKGCGVTSGYSIPAPLPQW